MGGCYFVLNKRKLRLHGDRSARFAHGRTMALNRLAPPNLADPDCIDAELREEDGWAQVPPPEGVQEKAASQPQQRSPPPRSSRIEHSYVPLTNILRTCVRRTLFSLNL